MIYLSLCIPTYNRCVVLDNTLNRLFSNPEFDENRVEVIVSDNFSTDDTKAIVSKYPLVKYYRNKANIKDLNFATALGYAKGKYIRLFNDTLSFKPKALERMLLEIEHGLANNENIFFYENMFLNSNCQKEIDSATSYIKEVGHLTTWIANFGAWREDFLNIVDKDRYAALQLTQVDWSFQIVKNSKKTKIYFGELFEVQALNKKGGYNVFDTFINKYLFIIKQQKLSLSTYELEKYRLCHYFIYPWLIKLFITDRAAFSFDMKGAFKIIFFKYWYEPYFYIMILLFWFRQLKNMRDGK
ncbi:MAG: glycosyltransferase family 2 protein [Mucilaginibacter sp.]|nr:glycosyltransferase family 2 protein [Mucilaginibacter sp.]